MSSAQPVSLKLDEDMRARLHKLSRAHDRSTHWLMRQAVSEYLEREEQREALRESARQAWHEYELTGMHATHAEANSWLAKLAAGEDAEPPTCHN